jgi:hypothetical protein
VPKWRGFALCDVTALLKGLKGSKSGADKKLHAALLPLAHAAEVSCG